MKKRIEHINIGDEEIHKGNIQKIIEPLWWSVNIYDGEEQYNKDLSKFSPPQRYVFAIQWYFAEVYNGGHDQFFFNSTGIVWKDALEGFKAAGLTECADILSGAAQRMGGNPSLDREVRWDVMDDLQPDFEELDKQLYCIDDADINSQLMKYINDNKESFYFDGDVELYEP